MKILLVDDSQAQRFIQKKILKENGISDSDIDEAKNGAEALKKAKEGNYSVIMMDINMPEMDGLTSFKEMRAAGVKTSVVVITSEADGSKLAEATKAGVDNYIIKPINPKKFWEIAGRYL